jgi:hypothetical protein
MASSSFSCSIWRFGLRAFTALSLAGASIFGATQPTTRAPPPCGDQGSDNRPNVCSKLVDGYWVTHSSTCVKNADGTFTYTHCDGVTKQVMKDSTGVPNTHTCCLRSSTCPGASYVGNCGD